MTNCLKIMLLVVLCWPSTTLAAPVAVNQPMPRFDLKDQNDRQYPFETHFRNKVVMVVMSNFCSMELAGVWGIPSYYRFYRHADFRFAFVFSRRCIPGFIPNAFVSSSVDNGATSLRLPYILMDWEHQLSQKLGVPEKYPQIYILDRQGIVRWKKTINNPFMPVEPMEQKIQALLDKQ